MSKAKSRCQTHTTWRGRCLVLTEGLRNVNIFLTLPVFNKSSATRHRAGPSRPATTQNYFVTHPFCNSTQQKVIRFVRNSFPFKSIQQTLDPHIIIRQVHIRTHRCTTLANCSVQRTSSPLLSIRKCSTVGVICDIADDDDDPQCDRNRC